VGSRRLRSAAGVGRTWPKPSGRSGSGVAPTRQAAEGLEVGVLVVSGGRGGCCTGGEVVAGLAAGGAGGWLAQAPASAATTRTRGRVGRARRTMGSGWHIVEEGDHLAVVHGQTDRKPRRRRMDSQEAARRWAATWTVAWQTHDVESVVDLYADECVHRSTPFRPPHHRRQASATTSPRRSPTSSGSTRCALAPGRSERPCLGGVLGQVPGPAGHGDDAGRLRRGPICWRWPHRRGPRLLAPGARSSAAAAAAVGPVGRLGRPGSATDPSTSKASTARP
jgi:hypothetical protein